MEEAGSFEASSQFSPAPKRKINKRFIYLIVAVVVIVLLFGVFKFLNLGASNNDINSDINNSADQETVTETPTPTPTDTPTPEVTETPTPTDTPTPKPTSNPVDTTTGLDRSTLSITIQNGSGQAGVAGKASDLLKGLGYNVSSTGNADNFDYVNVSVSVKASESKFLNLLKKDLETEYTVSSSSSNLDNGFSSDALVIIGK